MHVRRQRCLQRSNFAIEAAKVEVQFHTVTKAPTTVLADTRPPLAMGSGRFEDVPTAIVRRIKIAKPRTEHSTDIECQIAAR
jgi:hypothetical protein